MADLCRLLFRCRLCLLDGSLCPENNWAGAWMAQGQKKKKTLFMDKRNGCSIDCALEPQNGWNEAFVLYLILTTKEQDPFLLRQSATSPKDSKAALCAGTLSRSLVVVYAYRGEMLQHVIKVLSCSLLGLYVCYILELSNSIFPWILLLMTRWWE